jgi:hypothetical protein
MNALRLFPLLLVALVACQKDDEGDAVPSGGNGSGSVSVWTPEMKFTLNGQQRILSAAGWTFTSASTTHRRWPSISREAIESAGGLSGNAVACAGNASKISIRETTKYWVVLCSIGHIGIACFSL